MKVPRFNNAEKRETVCVSDFRYAIGIDPGTSTGVAVWHRTEKRFMAIKTMPIHRAMEFVACHCEDEPLTVVLVEDARKITLPKHLQRHDSHKYSQGVGSVKRDCSIWENFLTDMKIPFVMKDPRTQKKKVDKAAFSAMTGWKRDDGGAINTSSHGRDAAMMVWGV